MIEIVTKLHLLFLMATPASKTSKTNHHKDGLCQKYYTSCSVGFNKMLCTYSMMESRLDIVRWGPRWVFHIFSLGAVGCGWRTISVCLEITYVWNLNGDCETNTDKMENVLDLWSSLVSQHNAFHVLESQLVLTCTMHHTWMKVVLWGWCKLNKYFIRKCQNYVYIKWEYWSTM